jgi:hypothetical protein
MKQCNKCGLIKDDEEFPWRNRLLGRRFNTCYACKRIYDNAWYSDHQEEQRGRIKNRRAQKVEEAQKFIYDYLSNQRCVDCGEYDFSILTFDHVRGTKKKDISRMMNDGDSIEAITEEIFKCEVVCFNCHMRRENMRRSGGRFRKHWPE